MTDNAIRAGVAIAAAACLANPALAAGAFMQHAPQAQVGAATPDPFAQAVNDLQGGSLNADQIGRLSYFLDVIVIDLDKDADPDQQAKIGIALKQIAVDVDAVRAAVKANVPLHGRLLDKSVDESRIVAVTGRPDGTIAVYLGMTPS
ncbi:MAG TPA: hypothetical protein VFO41_16205 [Alphaproteobacteria bacterium]|nr:hypothetical protein [Alphaproteobacteria bacterium]